MPDDALLISGQMEPEFAREFARITYNLGGGYTPSILVGPSTGLGVYVVRFKALPNRPGDARFTVVDDGDGNTNKTWAAYLRDFHTRRMVDGASFEITDEETGDTVDVVFVDDSLNYRAVGTNVFATEFRVREYREPA
jgi:hypothetical protein